ncbi:hypothetical protein GM415_05470 [Pseudodesulfovibrio cashew]|uniref:TPM domain-containing protein n=1 Tax=Pseudodesulfovibrio cashew TaxID=2678688 RepID=A0A6I6JEZ4_9BACT|nr:TPM domain-containing protein [Pseudodesulfovibrio cashew]QGY39588.1 hypothetical protein GM415_05470 [Pseudodesulfovibrio cashew]
MPGRVLPLLLAVLLGWTACAWGLEVPASDGYVTDLAGIMSSYTEQTVEQKLADLDRTDSTQVAVLTIPSLEGEDLEGFSLKVAEAWGIGQKGKDNGALLLISKADRKIRIEVGYGLEDTLTDIRAGRIIDQEMSPRFRKGDFDGGVMAGVDGIVDTVLGRYEATRAPEDKGESWLSIVLGILFFPVLILMSSPRLVYYLIGKFIFKVPPDSLRGNRYPGSGPTGSGGIGFGGGGFGGGFGGGGFGGGGASGGW